MKPPPLPATSAPTFGPTWRQIVLLVLVVVIAGLLAIVPSIKMALHRAREAEEISNIRSLKLVLDSFAVDNDGVYPNDDTAEFYEIHRSKSSNDLFRQLFASGNINSEKIFWSADSPVCSPQRPDDVTTTAGKFDSAQTLQPGDNHWAYFTDLANTNHPLRPIFVEPYVPGTTTFEKKLWGTKVVILRIDGSAGPMELTSAGTILDAKGKNILTTDSKLWSGATPDLRQPDPVAP